MKQIRPALVVILLLSLLAGCTSATVPPTLGTSEPTVMNPTAAPTAAPTATPAETVEAAPTTETTSAQETTPLPPSAQGRWLRFSTAEKLCSNSPVLIGGNFIGTGSTTFCYADTSAEKTAWPTATVPIGERASAAVRFPPGGGLVVATDAGVCNDVSWQQPNPTGFAWECQSADQGFPYSNIREMINMGTDPVYMLPNAVVYQDKTFSLPGIVGVTSAKPTWIAIAGEIDGQARIWAGTNGYGVVSIDPQSGSTQHYTKANGLPGDEVRDVTAEPTPKGTTSNVWVATDGGVAYWDGQAWTAYTTANGLPSNDVRGVSSPGAHTVWVATGGGPAYFDGTSWRTWTSADGLPEGDMNGVLVRGGEVWFSTQGYGLIVFVLPGGQ